MKNINYQKIRGNWLLTSIKLIIVLLSCNISFAQNLSIRGTISDKDSGEPLIGVSIVEKETTNGTVSSADGSFSMNVESLNSILVFTYLGYSSQEINLAGRNNLIVELSEDALSMDELVVVGYGTVRKGNLAASVSTVRSEDIMRSASTTTAGALVGKVAGVTARQKSGVPGSSTTLQIRNMGTPLYVIDGIMKDESAFNNLDIQDIDNISILKDGAAAIYGVRAANGVILVTTKTGKIGKKTEVNINTYTGWQSWTKYPKLLNAYEWNYANDMADINSRTLIDPNEIARKKEELEKWKAGYYNPETGEDFRGFDWYKGFVNNAAPQNYINLNLNGGNDKSDYYISLGHINQDAVFKDYNFNRTNLTGNFNFKLSERMKLGFQLLGKIQTRRNPALPGGDDYAEMRSSLFNLIPIKRPYANDNPEYLNYMSGHDAARNMAAYTIDNAGEFLETWKTVQPVINLEYKLPVDGLKFKSLFSYYYADKNASDFEKGWKEYEFDYVNKLYVEKYDRVALGNTYLGKSTENVQEVTGQALLDLDRTLNQLHKITGVIGFEFFKRNWNMLNISQSPANNTFIDLIKNSKNNIVTNSATTQTTASFIMRAGYVYAQKYIIDFAGRYDASWRFMKGQQWGFFPSVSAAWILSEEDFFKNSSISDWFSNAKLRASYGAMGDDNLGSLYPDFAYLPGYTYDSGQYILTTNPLTGAANDNLLIGTRPKGVPITTLSWVKTSIVNLGIDLGFFKNKLNAEFDVFRRMRDGMAALPNNVIFPLESGMSVLPMNLNSDQTVGVDGFIKWNDRVNDFNYFIGINATLARQKNGKRYGELFLNAWDKYRWTQENRWANVQNGEMWMWETIGVFQNQEEIDNYPVIIDGANNNNLRPGDIIFKDQNGDGVINDFDKRPLGYSSADWPWDSSKGNRNPLMSLGLNFGFNWKGIDFGTDFAAGFMNTFIPDWHVKYGPTRTQTGYYYNSIDVWRHEDIYDPTTPWIPGKFPSPRGWQNPSIRDWNNYYSKEINYLRLRNLVLGYTLPANWTKQISIQKLRLYFEVSNLWVWDTLSDYGFDPETSTVTGFDYPQHKTYLIGLNITF